MREALYIKINKIVIYNLILNGKKEKEKPKQIWQWAGPKLTPPSVLEKSKFQKADIPTARFANPYKFPASIFDQPNPK